MSVSFIRPLRQLLFLITPLHLGVLGVEFGLSLRRSRAVIECAFGRLKVNEGDSPSHFIIYAYFVLHNYKQACKETVDDSRVMTQSDVIGPGTHATKLRERVVPEVTFPVIPSGRRPCRASHTGLIYDSSGWLIILTFLLRLSVGEMTDFLCSVALCFVSLSVVAFFALTYPFFFFPALLQHFLRKDILVFRTQNMKNAPD